MAISCVIMAHVSRSGMVKELLKQLDGDVTVSFDTEAPSRDPEQRWANGRAAWLAAADQATSDWCMVVQDDAVVCEDFLAGFEVALGQFPGEGVVSAYLGAGRPNERHVQREAALAQRRGLSWVSMAWLHWGVAFALPAARVAEMVRWCDGRTGAPYDMRVARWCRDVAGWRCWYTFPSLADHRDEKSLVGHDVPGRKAARFLQGSALEADWSKVPEGGIVITSGR